MDGVTPGPMRDPSEWRRSTWRLQALASLLRERCAEVVAEWERVGDEREGRAVVRPRLLDEAARLAERINEIAEALAEGDLGVDGPIDAADVQQAAIIEAALDSVIAVDAEDRVVAWNRAAERTFGYAREEAIGRDMAELIIPPDLREAHRTGVARVLATGEERYLNVRLETRALRKDGSELPVELVITRVPAPGAAMFAGHIRDLTDRRRAERALRESEALLQSVCDHSPSVIFVKDAAGRYLFINNEYERLHDVDRRDVVGKVDDDIHPSAVARAVRDADRRVLETGVPEVFEEMIPTVFGERAFVSAKFALLDSHGDPYAVCGIATDLTDRKRVEEALRRSETRYRLATEATTGAIWDWDLPTDHLEWSAGVQSLFG
jgi:PAS domain S-box-containing protein